MRIVMAEPIASAYPSEVASFRNEWAVLLECASPARDYHKLADLLQSVDWGRLLLLAQEHGVTGHVAAGLRELDENPIPPEIRQALVDRQRAQTFVTMRLTAELFRILESFSSEGIAALVIKGP